jgi:ribosomal protein S18 acetylase RimI-like enzyme
MPTIRTATSADRAKLTEFARRTFEETFAPQNTPENMRAYLDEAFNETRQAEELADPERVTLVAEDNGVVIGYAQLRRADSPPCVTERYSIELVRLYVDRTLQGRGLARELMQAAEEHARSRAQAVWLGVWEHNPRAIAFYAKCGFERVGTHHFKLGSDVQTDHIMVKRLS